MAEKFHRATFTRNFLKTITRIKNPDEMLAEAKAEGLKQINMRVMAEQQRSGGRSM